MIRCSNSGLVAERRSEFSRRPDATGRMAQPTFFEQPPSSTLADIAALTEARTRGLLTVALLGYDGGEILRRGLADLPIVVPSDYIPRIQEVQASIYHVLIELLRERGAPDA